MPAVLTPQPIDGDEPLVFDDTISFSGGMVSNVRANLLEKTQSALLKNFDLDQTGQLVTRKGSARIGDTFSPASAIQGLGYFDIPSKEELLTVINTSFYRSTGGAWSSLGGYTAGSDSLQVNFAQSVNYAYWVDGSGPMNRYDGTVIQTSAVFGVAAPPPSGLKYICEHRGRVVAAGDPNNPEWVYFSDVLSPNFPITQIFKPGSGDGDPVKGIVSWINNLLLVFKERSIYVINTQDPSPINWSIDLIHGNIGCISHRSIVQIFQDVYFLAQDGVRSVQRTIQDGQQSVSTPLSFPINDYMRRINSVQYERCCGTQWNNRYILSVPLDNASQPDNIFVWHTVNQSWSGYWTGWNATVFASSAFSGERRMNFGTSMGKVLQWREFVTEANEVPSDFQDDGVDIESQILTRAYIFDYYMNPKFGSHFEIEFFQSEATTSISAYVDGTAASTVDGGFNTAASNGFTVPITLPFTIPVGGIVRFYGDLRQFNEFREIQIQLVSTSNKLVVRSILLGANINTLKLATLSV
jgi:hypothetical protein